MTDPSHVEIRILSQHHYVGVARAAVQALAAKLGFSEEHIGHIILAVDEALTNVIRHGYHGRNDRPIWLRMNPINGGDLFGLEIVIEDEAPSVDLAKIKGRPLDEIRPGGLGVHIITKMMDEVEYARRPDAQGLRLRMRKYCTLRPEPPKT